MKVWSFFGSVSQFTEALKLKKAITSVIDNMCDKSTCLPQVCGLSVTCVGAWSQRSRCLKFNWSFMSQHVACLHSPFRDLQNKYMCPFVFIFSSGCVCLPGSSVVPAGLVDPGPQNSNIIRNHVIQSLEFFLNSLQLHYLCLSLSGPVGIKSLLSSIYKHNINIFTPTGLATILKSSASTH